MIHSLSAYVKLQWFVARSLCGPVVCGSIRLTAITIMIKANNNRHNVLYTISEQDCSCCGLCYTYNRLTVDVNMGKSLGLVGIVRIAEDIINFSQIVQFT